MTARYACYIYLVFLFFFSFFLAFLILYVITFIAVIKYFEIKNTKMYNLLFISYTRKHAQRCSVIFSLPCDLNTVTIYKSLFFPTSVLLIA